MIKQPNFTLDHFFGDDVLAAFLQIGELIHEFEHDFFHHAAEGAGACVALQGALGDEFEGAFRIFELAAFHLEELLILLHEGILRFGQNLNHRGFGQGHQGREDRKAADEFWDHAVLDQIVGRDLKQKLAFVIIAFKATVSFGAVPDHLAAKAFADDLVEADESTAADKENIGSIDLDVLLFGVLAAALGGDIGDGAFEHLEKRLLHAFTGDVPGDRDIHIGFADLVDFINVDDAALRGFEIVIGGLEQFEEEIFDIFADVARFGERGGVADGEGNVETAGEGLGEERLAGAGGSDQ